MGLPVLLRHPEVATRSCTDCQTWQYDKNGEIEKARDGGRMKRIGITPCVTCPKKSPAEAKDYELSQRNHKAVEFYYATRAMRGMNLSEAQKQDALLSRNMARIERIVTDFEAEQATLRMAGTIVASLVPVTASDRKRRAK